MHITSSGGRRRLALVLTPLLLVAALAGCSAPSTASSTPTPAAAATPPAGYTGLINDVAWRFAKPAERKACTGRASCVTVIVKAMSGCSSLYVEANLIDASDRVIGYTNDAISNLSVGEEAQIELSTYEKDFDTFRLTEISCR